MRAQALSSDSGFPSDTNLLVDACIARVRETARLDDDAVLPPLPKVAPRCDVVIFTREETASNAARSAARAHPTVAIRTPVGSRRRSGRGSRWALALCALVASAFGTAAFLASPAGRAPSVVRATSTARAHATAAVHATAGLLTGGSR